MKNFKIKSKVLLVAAALTMVSMAPVVEEFTGLDAFAQVSVSSPERAATAAAARAARPKIKSTYGIGERFGKTLRKIQEIMNAEEIDEVGYREVLEILSKQRIDRLNSAELLSFYQFSAASEQNLGNMAGAKQHYINILAMDSISYSMRDQMTFVVGQIEFSDGNYDTAMGYFDEWLKYQPTPSITQIIMFANVYYSIAISEGISPVEEEKNYRSAIEFLNWAISKAAAEGKPDKETWYAILRAVHNNLEEMDKALEYTELLATRWPKKDYWTQLSGLYAQKSASDGLSEEEATMYEKKQMATYELLYRQNMLDKGRELESMAQLYLYHEAAYQSSKIMSKSLDEGLSEKNYRNLNLLSIALMNGKDFEKSIEPLKQVAELAEDGNGYIQLANIYLNLDRYEEATVAIDKGIAMGGVKRADQSRILQGHAYLSLEMFDKAREAFREARKAAKDDRTRKNANNMLRYAEVEEKRIKDIKEYLS